MDMGVAHRKPKQKELEQNDIIQTVLHMFRTYLIQEYLNLHNNFKSDGMFLGLGRFCLLVEFYQGGSAANEATWSNI